LLISAVANAETFQFALDSSELVGHPIGSYSFLLSLTDGSGFGDANSTIVLSNISLGGGSITGDPFIFGGASGSLMTTISVTDSASLSLFIQDFAPGNVISFLFEVSSLQGTLSLPDRLSFSILDNAGVPLPTLAPFGDYFLGIDLSSVGPVITVYGSDASRLPSEGGPIFIPAPTVTPIPEPSSTYVVACVLATILVSTRRTAR
jgi:hypothetical protein